MGTFDAGATAAREPADRTGAGARLCEVVQMRAGPVIRVDHPFEVSGIGLDPDERQEGIDCVADGPYERHAPPDVLAAEVGLDDRDSIGEERAVGEVGPSMRSASRCSIARYPELNPMRSVIPTSWRVVLLDGVLAPERLRHRCLQGPSQANELIVGPRPSPPRRESSRPARC
jgi:hypothetical protein